MLLNHPRGELAGRFEEYRANDARFRAVTDAAKADFDASGLTAHNWEHAYRDALNAIVIGEAEGADMDIVMPAVVMHDIGFLWGATGKTHGAVGAEKLDEFLERHGIVFDEAERAHIAACIRTHKGSMHGEVPETLEAQVVADADLLEKFGPFGIYTSIRTFGEFNYDIEKVIARLGKMDELALTTPTGRRIAEAGRKMVGEFGAILDRAQEPYRS